MIDFIQSETQFFILCLTTLFTLINPIGIAPLLVVMTERFSKGERVKIQGYLEDFALSKQEADELIMSARNIVYKD